MQNSADAQVRSILELSELMLVVSEQGMLSCDDDGCLLLNGMLRDFAYRLRDAAARERKLHADAGAEDGGQVEWPLPHR